MPSSNLPHDPHPHDAPDPHDPLGLDAADRAIRINHLEDQVANLGVGTSGVSDSCPPEVHEQFLKNIIDYESTPLSCQFDALIKSGVELPQPDTLDDAALAAKLWEVIGALAKRDVYLFHTNHLSDRELYERLWHDLLREKGPIMPPGSGWIHHIDTIGSGSEEAIQLGLRYYDDEATRKRWATDFPKDVIPPHEDPPFHRDHLLPKPPEPKFIEWIEDETEEPDGPDNNP